jgi:tetratricopeptide (TPR) repeat protein
VDVADAIDRARRLQEEGKADEALDLLLGAAREGRSEDLDLEISLFYTERGLASRDDAAAEKDFDEARRWCEHPLTLTGMAGLAVRRGDLDKAAGLVDRALEMDPEMPWALYYQGRMALDRGDAAAAASALRKAVEGAPGLGPAWAALAGALREEGRRDEAIAALSLGIRSCPGDDGLLVAAGLFWTAEKDRTKARQAWRRAAEINRKNPDAWRFVALGAAEAGDELEMHQALDRAMELDADGTRAWIEKEGSGAPSLRAYLK